MQLDTVTDHNNRLNNLLSFLHKQNLTFLTHPSSIPNFNLINQWTTAALIIALLAAFRFRTVLLIRFRQNTTPSIPLLLDEIHYCDDDDDDDDETCSTPSTSSEFEDDTDKEEEEEDNRTDGEFFRVRGSGNGDGSGFLRGRSFSDLFSLSEIANNKSVVKLWDTIGFGLGFGFDHSDSADGSVVSVYGSNVEQSASPTVVFSAGENAAGNLALSIWDTRLRRRIPAVIAEWGPGFGKNFEVESGGVQKVYVTENGRYGLTVGDVRNVKSPLHLTQS